MRLLEGHPAGAAPRLHAGAAEGKGREATKDGDWQQGGLAIRLAPCPQHLSPQQQGPHFRGACFTLGTLRSRTTQFAPGKLPSLRRQPGPLPR